MTSPKTFRKNKADFYPNDKTFRLLFSNHPNPMWVIDAKTLGLLDVNDAALEKYGYTRNEFLALTIKDIHPSEEVTHLIKALEQKRPVLDHPGDWRHCLKNGQIIDVEITKHAFDFEGHKAMLIMAHDITERKQAEEQLRILKYSIDVAPDGAYWMDREGRFLYANETGCKVLGYTYEELMQMRVSDVNPRATPERWSQIWQDIKEKKSIEIRSVHRRKDGSEFPVELTSTYVKFGEEEYCNGFAKDITERLQADEVLIRTNEQLSLAQRSAGAGLWDWDMPTGKLDWSLELFRLFGLEPGETNATFDVWRSLLHPDDRQMAEERINEAIRDHKPLLNEYRIVMPSGQIRWINALGDTQYAEEGKPVRMSGICIDITERKRTEDALRESEKRFATIFRANPAAIAMTRLEDGHLVDVNAAWQRLTGYMHTEVVGHNPLELHLWANPEQRERLVEMVEERGRANGEIQLRCKSGEICDLLMSAELIELNGRRYLLTMAQDITDRKQAEKKIRELNTELEERVEARTGELREVQEKLIRQEKLAVLGQLAGGVGHELRNPLAVINNALYYLNLVGASDGEKLKEYLGIIQAETHNAEKIINDLLDFSRIKSVDVEPVSASELVERVLERYPAPKTVQVTPDIPQDLPMLYADRRQMEQVLGNLVINACQAMSTGGELTITARQEQGMIAIAVKDTGVGISPENMKRLFEPLFTTKAKGIGLGLAVSQKLAEANGGRIEVESEPGVGSTFTLVLPLNKG